MSDKVPEPLDRVFLKMGVITPVALVLFMTLLATKFRSAFGSMGVEVPLVTHLFLSFYWTLLLLPILMLAAWRYLSGKKYRAILIIGFGLLNSVILWFLCMWVMYLPIFQLAPAL
jgi:hypothetical protein